MEKQLGDFKGIHQGKRKRTCIIIYTFYYIYNIFFKLFINIGVVIGGDNDGSTDEIHGDLIAIVPTLILLNYATSSTD